MDAKKLIERLSAGMDCSPEDARNMLDAFNRVIARRCGNLDTVAVPGFGSFETKKRQERVAVNPASGKRLLVPPKILLTFKPSAILKKRVKG